MATWPPPQIFRHFLSVLLFGRKFKGVTHLLKPPLLPKMGGNSRNRAGKEIDIVTIFTRTSAGKTRRVARNFLLNTRWARSRDHLQYIIIVTKRVLPSVGVVCCRMRWCVTQSDRDGHLNIFFPFCFFFVFCCVVLLFV